MSSIQSIIPTSCRLGEFVVIGKQVKIGEGVHIWHHANLYGCELGDNVMIGSYTEVQDDVIILKNTRIQSHSFICSGTRIGENCFISHSVVTINDNFKNGQVNYDKESWGNLVINDDVIIGSGAILFPVKIHRGAIIGAGAVVLHDVPAGVTVVGNPAKQIR